MHLMSTHKNYKVRDENRKSCTISRVYLERGDNAICYPNAVSVDMGIIECMSSLN